MGVIPHLGQHSAEEFVVCMKPIRVHVSCELTMCKALFKYLILNRHSFIEGSQLPYGEYHCYFILGIRGLQQREFMPLAQGHPYNE